MSCTIVVAEDAFTVTGPCTATGLCFQSPNYPNSYGNLESCSIKVKAGVLGLLHANSFDVEAYGCKFDSLSVRGRKYCNTYKFPELVINQPIVSGERGDEISGVMKSRGPQTRVTRDRTTDSKSA